MPTLDEIIDSPPEVIADTILRLMINRSPKEGIQLVTDASSIEDTLGSDLKYYSSCLMPGTDWTSIISIDSDGPDATPDVVTPDMQRKHFGRATFLEDMNTLKNALDKIVAKEPIGQAEKDALAHYPALLEGCKKNIRGWIEMIRKDNRNIAGDVGVMLGIILSEQSLAEAEGREVEGNVTTIMKRQNGLEHIDRHLAPMFAALCRKRGIQVIPFGAHRPGQA